MKRVDDWVKPCRACSGRDFDLRRRGDRLGRSCRTCRAAAFKRYRAKDPEKWRAIDRRRNREAYWRAKPVRRVAA